MINVIVMRIVKILIIIIFIAKVEFAMCQHSDENVFDPKLAGKLFIHNSEIAGNQFFLNNWYKSDIRLRNGVVLKDKYLNYNGYLNKFVWFNNLNKQIILDDYFISEVRINIDSVNSLLFSRIIYVDDKLRDSIEIFAQLLSLGQIKLFAYRKVVKVSNIVVSNQNGSFDKALIEYKPTYIFVMPDGEQVYIDKLSNRKLIKSFPETKRKVIKQTLKDNNLKIKSEEDLMQFNLIYSEVITKY